MFAALEEAIAAFRGERFFEAFRRARELRGMARRDDRPRRVRRAALPPVSARGPARRDGLSGARARGDPLPGAARGHPGVPRDHPPLGAQPPLRRARVARSQRSGGHPRRSHEDRRRAPGRPGRHRAGPSPDPPAGHHPLREADGPAGAAAERPAAHPRQHAAVPARPEQHGALRGPRRHRSSRGYGQRHTLPAGGERGDARGDRTISSSTSPIDRRSPAGSG